ncbi:uncharacterized protein BDV17DRAFT_291081 [Aspergillus undulatus]|uniref:uncharacterized protein n=1 Tax=Aspergillus undulatus TaxID=1810928 RepID=UPI003CCCDF2E
MADLMIWMSMDGYQGYQPSAEITPGPQYPDLEARRKRYHEELQELGYALLKSCIDFQKEHGQFASQWAEWRKRCFGRRYAGGLLEHLPRVPWIESVLLCEKALSALEPEEREQYSMGLAIYRAAYKASDEEWATVKRNMEAHLSAWGTHVPNADKVKPLPQLHWFDCKVLGIDPSDTAAARSHFQNVRESYQYKFDPRVSLIIDDWNKLNLLGGNSFQGHLPAVDPDYIPCKTPEEQEALDTTRPGYKCYTGPTVPSQVREWKANNATKGPMLDMFAKWLKGKDPEAAAKPEYSKHYPVPQGIPKPRLQAPD